MKRPSEILAGGKPGQRAPWFSIPLVRFDETIGPLTDGIRSLPDDLLAAEIDQLVAICSEDDHHHGERLMLGIYDAELARRGDPTMQFDQALDLALFRIERQTNEADRQVVEDIGRRIFAAGGRDALVAAYRRMMALARPKQRSVREKMLAKRWGNIA